MTASLFKNLAKPISNYPFLKTLVLGGESFVSNCEHMKKIIQNEKIKVFNIYGISELSCWSTYHLVREKDLK